MDDLLVDFLTETREGLQNLDEALLQLERNPRDRATLSEVFRTIHTIKGTCGFLGLPRLESVAHAAENVLGLWRDGSLAVTGPGINHILAAVDRIRGIVAGLEASGAEPEGDDSALQGALAAAARGEGTHAEETQAEGTQSEGSHGLGPAPDAPLSEEPPVPAEGVAAHAPQSIRVAVEVLEELMVLVSELVLTRNQLMQLARTDENVAYTVPLQRLSQITSDLQDGVMKTRMQPIGHAWSKLPRLVRDLSQELGKRIELEMRGADTELDRQVLELIKDPLTHMVRNSADHGLETPKQRRAAGKPETGRILLNAFHQGGHIVLEIGDDGRGLSTERIKAKALAQGFATEAELAAMPDHEVHRFIFRAGFSTAAAVTSVSGRGVGMDVVKTNIERIGGLIDLRSREGRGTTFVIKIPLTLAIAAALIVACGGERFAIPQAGVLELVSVGGADGPRVERIKDAAVLRLRDRLLPLVSLKRLLRLEERPAEGEQDGFVVVAQVGAQVGAQLFGIVVDRVFDTEEIVVKPVAPILRHITMFSGNTILGDGSVIMILDPSGIARATGLDAEAGTDAAAAAPSTTGRSGAPTSLLLFRAGDGAPKAVPLGLVARLEHLPAERIERAGAGLVTQYRGHLMPLLTLPGARAAAPGELQPVLVFGDEERAMGLMVDQILDVMEVRLAIEPAGEREGFLGSCVVGGKVTEILDTAHWLRQGKPDWFGAAGSGARRSRVLLVEDSAFFRNLAIPALGSAGFEVVSVGDARDALRLREAGERFDAIISDIHMPGMDGHALARAVREGGGWAELPMIALSSQSGAEDVERGRAAGFSDYVVKFDRTALLASLRHCLQPGIG